MRVVDLQRRLAALQAGAKGIIEMKMSQDGEVMRMTQYCTICRAEAVTQLELSAAGDERLMTDLETFQAQHRHEQSA